MASGEPPAAAAYQRRVLPFAPEVPVSKTVPVPHRLAPVPTGAAGMALTVATTATRAAVLSHNVVEL